MAETSILLTNDDGIDSPGLWAAAHALSDIGLVTVVAPREQHTCAGRSMPRSSDGRIQERRVEVNGRAHRCYAVGGSPGQSVRHAILELLEAKPDVVVSGINYGENVGTCVSISGTVGAAVEAAAHFTRLGVELFLRVRGYEDVDILKIEVPSDAKSDTPWVVTRVARHYYYYPVRPTRSRLEDPAPFRHRIECDEKTLEPGTDVHALRVKRWVSVSPLSIDMTSRVNLDELERRLRRANGVENPR